MAQETILIIDDDRELNRILEKELGRLGYRVCIASDGLEGSRQVVEEKPSLVILDIMLPKKDGYEILRELKADVQTKDIPVILLTGLGLEEEIAKGINLGAEHYLIKPLRTKLLIKCIETSLQARR